MVKFKQRKPKSLIKNYFPSHGLAILTSLKKLWVSSFSAFMTILVIAGALTILSTFYLLLSNAQYLASSWQNSEAKISIYLKPNISEIEAERVIQVVKFNSAIEKAHYISPVEGLKEFTNTLGDNKITSILPANPLPGVIIATPILNFQNPDSVTKLTSELQQITNVDVVQLDTVWLQRLHNIVLVTARIAHFVTFLLAAGILLIIWNTIRLATQKEEQEIVVLQYIGATNNFIRRPFIYLGVWYGLLSGVLTCILVTLIMQWIEIPLNSLLASYGSDFSLIGLDFVQAVKLLGVSVLLSAIGAWSAVTVHLYSSRGLNHE